MKDTGSALLAGICIGIAGWGNLALAGVGAGIPGAVIFAFGLLAVVHYKFRLYTGTAGFISSAKEIPHLLYILLMNFAGTLLVGLLARISPLPVCAGAGKIIAARLALGPLKTGLLAIGCGFIMTTAVQFGREGKFLPLLFGVPMFIVCGFPHCVADAFYLCAAPLEGWWGWSALWFYLSIVLGNFIGCNLTRALLPLGSSK